MMGLAVHRMGIGPAGGGAPLDDYTSGLLRCYGTFQMLSSYSGPLLRVLRSSDSAQQDIGQASGQLDTSALISFVGGGNGTVETWYDQIGGIDATRRNNNQIVSAGVLRTGPSSGAPYINFPTAGTKGSLGDGFDFTALASAPYTAFALVETSTYGMVLQRLSGGAYVGFWFNGYTQAMPNQYLDGVLQTTTQSTYNALAAAGHAVVSGARSANFDSIACYRSSRFIAVAVYSGILSAAQVGDISAAIKGGV